MSRKQSEYLSKKAIDKIYEQVAIDIENGIQDKGVWARCFSESKGNEKKAKALYIETMVDELVLKAEALEEQRIEKEEARIEKEEARERIAQEKREKIEEEKRLKERQKRYEEANTLERFFIKTKEKILNFFIIAFFAFLIWFFSLGVAAIFDDLFDFCRRDDKSDKEVGDKHCHNLNDRLQNMKLPNVEGMVKILRSGERYMGPIYYVESIDTCVHEGVI